MKSYGPPSPRIPSRGIPTLRGKLLSDRRIDHYIRRGHYGPALQKSLLDREKKQKRTPRPRDPLAEAKAIIKNLLK